MVKRLTKKIQAKEDLLLSSPISNWPQIKKELASLKEAQTRYAQHLSHTQSYPAREPVLDQHGNWTCKLPNGDRSCELPVATGVFQKWFDLKAWRDL